MKRLAVATVLGVLAGLFCAWGAAARGFGFWTLAATVANRTLIGVAIGISGLRWPWWVHGAVIGAVFGLPLSLSAVPGGGFWVLEVASVVYGLVIEAVLSRLLRWPPGGGTVR